jgi:copper chaperone
MKEVTYDVPEVSCEHCVNAITKAAKESGVQEVEVDLVTKKVYVSFDPATVNEASLKEAIAEEGYDITGETSGKAFGNVATGKKILNFK